MAASASIAVVVCFLATVAGNANTETFATHEPTPSFTSIPEPGALVSLIGGAAVLIGIQRFRRRT